MKTKILAAIALAAISASAANAASISITTFSLAEFGTKSAGGTVEDFEGYAAGVWDNSTMTKVGTFTSLGGTGTGTSCQAIATRPCTTLAIQNSAPKAQGGVGEINGQGNLVPDNGTRSLSSDDTKGMLWTVMTASKKMFTGVVFALRDAADINGTVFSVTAGGVTKTLTAQTNNNKKLVVIDFGGAFDTASVKMTTATNDAFTIDGATIMPAPVPLPAAGLLLIGGLGALGALRKRKAAAI